MAIRHSYTHTHTRLLRMSPGGTPSQVESKKMNIGTIQFSVTYTSRSMLRILRRFFTRFSDTRKARESPRTHDREGMDFPLHLSLTIRKKKLRAFHFMYRTRALILSSPHDTLQEQAWEKNRTNYLFWCSPRLTTMAYTRMQVLLVYIYYIGTVYCYPWWICYSCCCWQRFFYVCNIQNSDNACQTDL